MAGSIEFGVCGSTCCIREVFIAWTRKGVRRCLPHFGEWHLPYLVVGSIIQMATKCMVLFIRVRKSMVEFQTSEKSVLEFLCTLDRGPSLGYLYRHSSKGLRGLRTEPKGHITLGSPYLATI